MNKLVSGHQGGNKQRVAIRMIHDMVRREHRQLPKIKNIRECVVVTLDDENKTVVTGTTIHEVYNKIAELHGIKQIEVQGYIKSLGDNT